MKIVFARGLFIVFFVQLVIYSIGQNPIANFNLAPSACREELLELTNSSTNAQSYWWDFCTDDFRTLVSSAEISSAIGFSDYYGFKLVESNNQWFGFVTVRDNHKLFRLNFGNSPLNTPTVTDLGNPGSKLNFPEGIDIHFDDGNWYGFIGSLDFSTAAQGIIRLDFGNSLTNAPTVQNLGNFGFTTRFRELKVIEQDSDLILVLVNYGGNTLVRINYRDSFDNPITAPNIFDTGVIAGANLLVGVDFIEVNGVWKAVIASLNNSKIIQLNFGSDVLSVPVVEGDYSLNGVIRPYNVKLVVDSDVYYALISNETVTAKIYDFKDLDPLNPPEEVIHIGLPSLLTVEGGRYEGKDFLLGVNGGSRRLRQIIFESSCDASFDFSTDVEPGEIFYTVAGTKKIELMAFNNTGNRSSKTQSITISNNVSPDVSIATDGKVCAMNTVEFTGNSVVGGIANYNWDFGDNTSGNGATILHIYSSSGNYNVKVTVASSNGCKNWDESEIEIFSQPSADFILPGAAPYCTNQNYLIENTSTFDPGSQPSWQWKVNGNDISDEEDLTYAFTTTISQDISLTASIPGCENEIIKSIGTLEEGPVVDFSASGMCEDEIVAFTNNTLGTVTDYSWDFDDGQNSTDANPTHVFSDIGVYDVTLTASNTTTGCNNTETKPITIYSKPEANFLLSPPPFSCNGTPAQFNDLTPNPTDSNIASWAWNFDDTGSSDNTSTLKNPQHTYANAGEYNVSLMVTTNFFCSATIQLPVTISQSPVADFTHEPACEDVPIGFSDASTGTIDSWDWMIGTTAYTIQNPTHTFNNSGNASATLTVTATNDCIGSVSKPIVVPVKLTPDFSVARNCVNQQTLFTDITNSAADPVSSQNWSFGTLGTTSGSPVEFTFSNTGGVNVSLTITTQTGCVYPVSKLVNITSSPQANFTPSPLAGAPPLAVQFTNTSVNATSYQWAFHDQNNSTSSAVSPTFVYQNLGEYQAELTATNAQNCFHKTSKTIRVVMPFVDVALGGLELMEFQNGFKPAVTIFNRGNVPVINLALLLNMSGPVIRERVNAIIIPNTSYRYVLSFEFPSTDDIDYFCIEAEVTDTSPDDNEVCLSPEQSFISFPPYPNPGKGLFNLDWIAKEAGIVNLTLINSMGQEEKNFQIESDEGLNPFILETQGLSAGVYFVKIKYLKFTKVYRVFVSE